jgi:hypothetical protein
MHGEEDLPISPSRAENRMRRARTRNDKYWQIVAKAGEMSAG